MRIFAVVWTASAITVSMEDVWVGVVHIIPVNRLPLMIFWDNSSNSHRPEVAVVVVVAGIM